MVVNVYATSATIEQCSRNELLAFVNSFLRVCQILRVLRSYLSGAAYCQLTELLFPGKISLKKVKWNSRNEVDWIANWRILQTAWKDLGVKKAVPVERLLRSKFQDNFEFLQWFKKFFDANYDGHPYDALSARSREPLPASWTVSSKSFSSKARIIAGNNPVSTPAKNGVRSIPSEKISVANNLVSQRKYELLIQQLKDDLIELTKQRNFYYDKLRKVELLCQEAKDSSTICRKEVLRILYETEEGFIIVDEEPDYEKNEKNDNNNSKKNMRDAIHQFNPDTSETF